ncbi:MAG: hypothetical protein AB3N20_16590 [Rhizobiaceae bacterium]
MDFAESPIAGAFCGLFEPQQRLHPFGTVEAFFAALIQPSEKCPVILRLGSPCGNCACREQLFPAKTPIDGALSHFYIAINGLGPDRSRITYRFAEDNLEQMRFLARRLLRQHIWVSRATCAPGVINA